MRFRVYVMGFKRGRTFHVRAGGLVEASEKVKKKLGLNFNQYIIEEDPEPS